MNTKDTSAVPLPALIIPDVHQQCARVESIIAEHGGNCASVVFLGDYVDSRESGDPTELHLAARWLARSVRDPRRVHLLGNHDVAYFYPRASTYCSGWTPERQRVFDEAFGPQGAGDTLSRLHLAAQVGPWVVSHAGFPNPLCRDASVAHLLHWAARAKVALSHADGTHQHPLNGCGRVRGGPDPVGGLFWLDWDHEFSPIPGIHQLVGHTNGKHVRGRHLSEQGALLASPLSSPRMQRRARTGAFRSLNWCLDTGLTNWAIVHADHLEIHTDSGVDVWPDPAPSAGRSYPELNDVGLSAVAGEHPPLHVPWSDIQRALPSEEAWAAFAQRLPIRKFNEAGPLPREVASALRALRRNGLLPPADR